MPVSASTRLALAVVLAALLIALALALVNAGPAPAHRSGCHAVHLCPSDHATYTWRLLCVSPSAEERDSSFSRRVSYGGRTWYCKVKTY